MEKPKKIGRLLILILAILLVVVVFVGVYFQTKPVRLYPGEVLEYNGENLSSINDIYENNIRGNQIVNRTTYRLTINGLVNEVKTYSYDEILNGFPHYEKVVTLHCIMGWSAKILWEGMLVRDLLETSGVNDTAKVVIFHAQDGYTTSMPVSYFYENDIIMAYKMNGLILPSEKGFPFELVAESKYGYKWIKWITQIELSDNEKYTGYWESRGYSNDAAIP